MQIDVGACIAELLYEQQAVTIPGLGAFVTTYKPASIDQVEGKIAPPSKQVSFNRNLLIDDGLLVKQLREKFQISYSEAMREVEAFAENIKAAIERREIVTFLGLGRLYKDFEQNYQFLPDGINFNADAYGLPTMDYFPVARTAAEKNYIPPTKNRGVPAAVRQPNWVQKNLLLVTTVAVLLTAGGVYLLLYFPKKNTLEQANGDTIPTARYNVSPTYNGETAEETAARDLGQDADEFDSERPTLSPGQKYCIINIGKFGKPENVDRLVKQIYEEGFEPYTEKSGTLTRVGVQMKYDKDAEVEAALRTIRKKIEPKASVLKK